MSEDTSAPFPTLLESLLEDQSHAWRWGERCSVEVMLERGVDLRENEEAVLDLIYHEWVLRGALGEMANPEEYRKRFPELGDQIGPMFEVYRALHPDGGGDEASNDPVASTGRRFRVLRPHARGGLGEVFVARDLELGREVALKRLRPELGGDAMSQRRFLREVEITGRLEHPGIVPVYGLDHDDDGLPCYAMRLIRGDTLQEAIERYHGMAGSSRDPGAQVLELRALLSRFVAACQAVAFAHSQGILHRDLKPANIMLGPYGETLVVDWGLAKTARMAELAQEGVACDAADASDATLPGPLGTPAFMSPEQAAGRLDRLGPPSDVYSLGASLYCLLTGCPPFVDGPAATVLDRVQHGDFLQPRAVNRAIDQALEAVCLRSMAREPHDRYATPLELAAEIERWQAGEPVEAYNEGWARRFGRWRRRHRTWARAATVSLVLITLASVVAALAINVARRNERASRAQADRALKAERAAKAEALANLKQAESHYQMTRDAVDRFYTRISQEKLLKQPQTEQLRRDLLEQAREFYQRLSDNRRGDPGAQLDLARALTRLSQIEHDLAAREPSIAHAEEARTLFETLAATRPSSVSMPGLEVADSICWAGFILNQAGRSGPARERMGRAVREFESLVSAEPARVDYRFRLAGGLLLLAGIGNAEGHLHAREELLARAYAQYAIVIARLPDRVDARLNSAHCLRQLSWLAKSSGRPERARETINEAVRELEALVTHRSSGDDPQVLRDRLIQLGAALREAGRHRESADTLRRAIAESQALITAHPGIVEHRDALARSLAFLGHVHLETDRLADARDDLRRSAKEYETILAALPNDPAAGDALGLRWLELAGIERREGRFLEAVEACGPATSIYERLLGKHPGLPAPATGLVGVCRALSRAQDESKRSPLADQVIDRVSKALYPARP